MMSFSKSLFWSDRTWDNDCKDSNQTFGSSFAGTYSPRAIAIVRFLYISLEAIPTLRVLTALRSSLSKSDQLPSTSHRVKWPRPHRRRTLHVRLYACGRIRSSFALLALF